jgi:signal transduction histidine kinase
MTPSMTEEKAPSTIVVAFNRARGSLEKLPPRLIAALNFTLAVVLSFGDYLTGADVAFTALYLVPIASAAWFGTRRQGLLLAAFCSVTGQVTIAISHSARLAPAVIAWNFVAQLATFGFAAVLVHGLRFALVEERQALVAAHQRTLEAQRQLQHAERLVTVGKLAAGVAHELGTPLNVVNSYAQMIEAGTVEGADVADRARIIREQTQSMTRIIRQLLDFARAGKPQRSPQNAMNLVATSLSMLSPIASRKQVELSAAEQAPLPVEADPGQLQQVFTNLIVNAIHAAPEGGHVWVTAEVVRVTPPPGVPPAALGWVAIRVKDDGGGIDAEVLPHVFEPFFTTKQVGEGTGLGLAVAYGMVREHGGWIAAENLAGGGACFTVYLPSSAA